MLENIDKVNWNKLYHSYGIAADVPQLFRKFAAASAEDRFHTWGDLINTIHHQGDIYSASAAVIPFFIELLQQEDFISKDLVFYTLISFAEGAENIGRAKKLTHLRDVIDTHQNIAAGIDTYIPFLNSDVSPLKYYAVYLLSFLPYQGAIVRLALWRAIKKEQDATILAEMLYALSLHVPSKIWLRRVKILQQAYANAFEKVAQTHPDNVVRVAAACGWAEVQRFRGVYNTTKSPEVSEAVIKVLADQIVTRETLPELVEELVPRYLGTDLRYISRLGLYPLAVTLSHPRIDAHIAHLIGREMLNKVFIPKNVIINTLSEDFSWDYYLKKGEQYIYDFGNSNHVLKFSGKAHLKDYQQFVLKQIVESDPFGESNTNLFSFFYGLPDWREELRKLTESEMRNE